jgi:MFS family permease
MDLEHSSRAKETRRTLLLPVYVPTALLGLAEGVLLPTLPAYALQFGVSFALASLVISAAGIGTLAADLPAGSLLGRIGLKSTMLLGAGLVAVGTFALGFASVVPLLILFRLISGFGTAMWGLSRHAFIAEAVDPRQRGRAISVFGGINRVGMFGGPALGGVVASQFSLPIAFFVAGILGAAAFIISAIYIKDTRAVVHTERHVRWGLVRQMLRVNWRDVSAASIAQIFAQLIRSGRQTIIPFYGLAVVGLNEAQVGFIQSASSVTDMFLFIPVGYMMDRFGRKVAAVPSFTVMAVGLALIPFTESYLTLMAASILIGIGNGLGSGTMMTLGADFAPPGATGEFLGLWRLVGDSGRAGGPLSVGALTDALGFEYTAYVLAGMGLAASSILALLVRETRIKDHVATEVTQAVRPPP